MKKFIKKYYHWFVIVAVAMLLVCVRKLAINTSSTPPVKNTTSMVKINEDQFGRAVCLPCEYSSFSERLTCPDDIIETITKNADSLKEVTEGSIKFYEDGGYIKVPASVLVEMIELKLLTKTGK